MVTEEQFPIGDDLVWYEMQLIVRDFDSLKWRVEKLGRQMQMTLDNNVKMSNDLMRRLSERNAVINQLTDELSALKGVTNA